MEIIYELSRQERHYFCVPAVFQAILRRYKIEETQESIAFEIETTEKNGTRLYNNPIHQFFKKRKLNSTTWWHNEVPMLIPELLIDRWQRENGHLYVCSRIKKEQDHARLIIDYNGREVTFLDPADLSKKLEDLEEFYSKMRKDQFGGFGLVTKN